MSKTPFPSGAATLEHLTGPGCGCVDWVPSGGADVWLGAGGVLQVTPPDHRPDDAVPVARLEPSPTGFVIHAAPESGLWVNGHPVQMARLHHGDIVEFGETGPMSRFLESGHARKPHPTLGGIAQDTVSYLRSSRQPLRRRLPRAAARAGHRLVWDTTLLFRTGVVLMLALLTVAVAVQFRSSRRIEQEVALRALQIEAVSAAVAQARREAITEADLKALGAEFRARAEGQAARLQSLEARSSARARVISATEGSVAFLQGSYGLRDRDSGRLLRQQVDEQGLPVLAPNGRPLLTLDGDGPPAEVEFNGTGFLLGDPPVLVTNRHVARPWEDEPGLAVGLAKLAPEMFRFIAYFPGREAPIDVRELRVSDSADLALLGLSDPPPAPGLALASAPPNPGDNVIVTGYPTGLLSMLAQAGPEFVEGLRRSGETNFWAVARELSAAGLLSPLSSAGIIGRVTPSVVVYDAETTHGASGSPVLDLGGSVVAVNAAIMPGFGGSNIGVPAGALIPLLEQAPGG